MSANRLKYQLTEQNRNRSKLLGKQLFMAGIDLNAHFINQTDEHQNGAVLFTTFYF